jgi:hypothetical protein
VKLAGPPAEQADVPRAARLARDLQAGGRPRELVMQIPSAGASPYASPTPQGSTGVTPAKTKADTAVDDFMAYANMTPAQKMRAAILGSMNMTEEQLNAMDPKERAKIEQKIKDIIKEKVEESIEKKTGVAVDLKV